MRISDAFADKQTLASRRIGDRHTLRVREWLIRYTKPREAGDGHGNLVVTQVGSSELASETHVGFNADQVLQVRSARTPWSGLEHVHAVLWVKCRNDHTLLGLFIAEVQDDVLELVQDFGLPKR